MGEDQDVVDAAVGHNAADEGGIAGRGAGRLEPLLALAAESEVLLDEKADADTSSVEAAEDILHVLVLDKLLGDTEPGHLHEAVGNVGLDHAMLFFDVGQHYAETVFQSFGLWDWVFRDANKRFLIKLCK